jgi:hypothetical protein
MILSQNSPGKRTMSATSITIYVHIYSDSGAFNPPNCRNRIGEGCNQSSMCS